MLTDTQQTRKAFTHSQLESLRVWLRGLRLELIRDNLVSAFVFFAVAAIGNVVAFVFVGYIEWMYMRDMPLLGFLIAGITVVGMHIFYFWRYHKPDAKENLAHGGRVRIASRRLEDDGHEHVDLFENGGLRVLRAQLLLFPIWALARMFVHLGHAYHVSRVDPWVMARALANIVRENRRVQLHDLDAALREPDLATVVHTLEAVHGVLFFTDGQLAVALNDELSNKIMQAAQIEDVG